MNFCDEYKMSTMHPYIDGSDEAFTCLLGPDIQASYTT